MEDVSAPPKKSTTLSVDRAAFLLLRVKKAFKKKRQQRKEKQTQPSGLVTNQSRSNRKVPPPLLRSRTLPAIVLPGIPVVSLCTDRATFQFDEHSTPSSASAFSSTISSTFGSTANAQGNHHRWSLLSRNAGANAQEGTAGIVGVTSSYHHNNNNNNNSTALKSLNLLKDDTLVAYRRKSSGSTPHSLSGGGNKATSQQEQLHHLPSDSYLPADDEFETHASDGSLLLRIPAPHVVAARAYRLASKKHTSTSQTTQIPDLRYSSDTGSFTQAPSTSASTSASASASASASTSASALASEGGVAGYEANTGPSSSTSSGAANTALTRLARLLHQSSSVAGASKSTPAPTSTSTGAAAAAAIPAQAQAPHQEMYVSCGGMQMATLPLTTGTDEAPRRLSWERRKDSGALHRSASIDSFARLVWSDSPRPSLVSAPVPFSKRPSASSLFSNSSGTSSQSVQLHINYGDIVASGNNRRESLLSPSATRRHKLHRIINDNFLPSHPQRTRARSKATTRRSDTNDRNDNDNDDDDNNDATSKDTVQLRREQRAHCHSVADKSETHSMHETVDVQAVADHPDAFSHASNLGPLRWSKRLAHNVSVNRIRSAISYNPPHSKEMECLIPQAIESTKANKTTELAVEAIDGNFTQIETIKENCLNNKRDMNCSPSKEFNAKLHKSKHATNNMKVTKMRHEQKESLSANCNGNGNPNAHANANGNGQNLVIYRQANQARVKGTNTPHRNKMSKKQLKLAQAQLDKLTQINLHLHALFAAVEHGHLDKARTIVESTDVDINSVNSDGLSVLDIAVLSNNRPMTKMLLQHGAVESSQYNIDSIELKLNGLLKDAESRINELSGTEALAQHTFAQRPSISSIIIGNTSSSVTGCTGNEIDKQIGIWERRIKGLRRLLLGWEQTRPPDAPAAVTVDVTADNAITAQIIEPPEGAICTKFKVQWSTRADFSNVVGEREIVEWTPISSGGMGTRCTITGLTQGRRYFIRAACGNVKCWGPYKSATPACVTPSSWRDFTNREDRCIGRQHILDNLFTAVRLARPADVSELTLDTTNSCKRNPKKKTTIKQLFSVASKFHKSLKRGVYLVSIIYCDDRVLVTNEDFLPAIEIDESYPSTFYSDFHWLMKISCTWDDVKSLRSDMGRNLTPAVHFRTKLLSAICQMQSALGLNDLGQLYYKPLRDSHGTMAISCVQSVKSQKVVSILNSRWLPVAKLQKKVIALLEDYNINDMLISSVAEQIHYQQRSLKALEPGLYLSYLKMQCSVDQIQIVVPANTPNVLPHAKVRDNSHITAEEWQTLTTHANNNIVDERVPSLQSMQLGSASTAAPMDERTEVQRLFLQHLMRAAHKLLTEMKIKPDEALSHRLYDIEVVELSRDISFIIICPPSVELNCATSAQSDLLLHHDKNLISMNVQVFELIHLRTYQMRITQKYSRLSCILELDTALANYSQREAFSTEEMQTAKERLMKLQELTANLNSVWKGVRWLMDVIAFARDKTVMPSPIMKEILEYHLNRVHDEGTKFCKSEFLQPPTRDDVRLTKSGSGRGSWPGPGTSTSGEGNNSGALASEQHSKSEQNLGMKSQSTGGSSCGSICNTTGNAATTAAGTGRQSMQSMDKTAKGIQKLLLQVTGGDMSSSATNAHATGTNRDNTMRKHSSDSIESSQYSSVTPTSVYSGTESTTAVHRIDYLDNSCIPSSRSDDTLATTTIVKQTSPKLLSSQRKRTTSSILLSNPPNPVITIQSSSACITKVKAASSGNLRDTEKPYGSGSMRATMPVGLTRRGGEDDSASCSSLSLEKATAASATLNQQQQQAATSTNESTGIIQVYTAYNTGLASGTSLKLNVTAKTSAREVINLVVEQLNMATLLKGNKNGPIYTGEMLDNFCLVAVIGARERCLRDDFKPLLLQNPWKKGRLYVRQKHELLAAIEHSNRKSHLI